VRARLSRARRHLALKIVKTAGSRSSRDCHPSFMSLDGASLLDLVHGDVCCVSMAQPALANQHPAYRAVGEHTAGSRWASTVYPASRMTVRRLLVWERTPIAQSCIRTKAHALHRLKRSRRFSAVCHIDHRLLRGSVPRPSFIGSLALCAAALTSCRTAGEAQLFVANDGSGPRFEFVLPASRRIDRGIPRI